MELLNQMQCIAKSIVTEIIHIPRSSRDAFITHNFFDAPAQNFALKYRFHQNTSFNFRYCQLSVNETGGQFQYCLW